MSVFLNSSLPYLFFMETVSRYVDLAGQENCVDRVSPELRHPLLLPRACRDKRCAPLHGTLTETEVHPFAH